MWNGERFLSEAIESVRAQTLTEHELIIVDDGSNDRSLDIAAGAAQRDRRIRVLSLRRTGLVNALNRGIDAARAPYVARMDADDVALPSRLQKQIAFLDANPSCVAAGSNCEVIDEEGLDVGSMHFPLRHVEIARALMKGITSLAHPAVVMRKDALEAAGRYRAGTFPSEDFDLWLRLSRIGELANIDERLLRHRLHRNAVSMRERERQIVLTAQLVQAARNGVPPRPRIVSPATNATARYHLACATVALRCGNRTAAAKHARASIAAARFWPRAYAALAATLLPAHSVQLAARCYSALRAAAL